MTKWVQHVAGMALFCMIFVVGMFVPMIVGVRLFGAIGFVIGLPLGVGLVLGTISWLSEEE